MIPHLWVVTLLFSAFLTPGFAPVAYGSSPSDAVKCTIQRILYKLKLRDDALTPLELPGAHTQNPKPRTEFRDQAESDLHEAIVGSTFTIERRLTSRGSGNYCSMLPKGFCEA